jgi:hypothetical protein
MKMQQSDEHREWNEYARQDGSGRQALGSPVTQVLRIVASRPDPELTTKEKTKRTSEMA